MTKQKIYTQQIIYLFQKHYWIIPVLFFLMVYRNDESWHQLSQNQFINHSLLEEDSFVIPKQKGIYYLNVLTNTTVKYPVLLDVMDADAADFLINGLPISPKIVEYRRNRIGYQKHFAVTVHQADSIKMRLCVFKTDTTKRVFVHFTTPQSFQELQGHFFYSDRATNLFIMLMLGAFLLQIIYIALLFVSRQRIEYFFYFVYCFEYTRLNFVIFQHQLGIDLDFLTYPNNLFFSSMILFLANTNFIRHFFIEYNLPTAYVIEGLASLNLIIYALFFINPVEQDSFSAKGYLMLYISSLFLIYPLFSSVKDRLKYFFLTGTLVVLIGAIISRIMFIFYPEAQYDHYAIRMLTYLLDFMLLNAALNYRNNQERRAQQQKLDNERSRIAAEMHDDLGAGLSTIRLLGERAQIGVEDLEKKQQIQKITIEANDLIEKMANLIWDMKIQEGTSESLIAHLRRYALDYFEDTDINCRFDMPDIPPSVSSTILLGKVHKQVFLTFKEVLNNVLKHAKATHISVSIAYQNAILGIEIIDNGIGFNTINTLGNGLKNMQERMASIGGSFSISSEKGKGTTVILRFKINKS